MMPCFETGTWTTKGSWKEKWWKNKTRIDSGKKKIKLHLKTEEAIISSNLRDKTDENDDTDNKNMDVIIHTELKDDAKDHKKDKTTTITCTSPKGAKAMDALRNLIDLNQEKDNEIKTDQTVNKPDIEATIEPKVTEIDNKSKITENKSNTSEKEVQSGKVGTKLLMIVENIKGHEKTFSEVEKTNFENKSNGNVNDETSVKDETLSKLETKSDSYVKEVCYAIIGMIGYTPHGTN